MNVRADVTTYTVIFVCTFQFLIYVFILQCLLLGFKATGVNSLAYNSSSSTIYDKHIKRVDNRFQVGPKC